MNRNFFIQDNPVISALVATILLFALVLSTFTMFEPTVVLGQVDSNEFEITQSITGEIAFETQPLAVIMAPAIPGLTGGVSSGTTSAAVRTNNPAGYQLAISFEDSTAMQYDLGAGSIPNYASTPTYNFSVSAGTAAFAFTASSSNLVSALLNDGSTNCGTGSTISLDKCWLMPVNATNAYTVVNRGSATPSGGHETEFAFRVGVGANPDPVLQIGTYTATATLTATENP